MEAHRQARAYRMSAGVLGRVGKLVVRRGLTICQLELLARWGSSQSGEGLDDVSWSYRQVGEARSQARAYRISAGVIGKLGKLVVRRGPT